MLGPPKYSPQAAHRQRDRPMGRSWGIVSSLLGQGVDAPVSLSGSEGGPARGRSGSGFARIDHIHGWMVRELRLPGATRGVTKGALGRRGLSIAEVGQSVAVTLESVLVGMSYLKRDKL